MQTENTGSFHILLLGDFSGRANREIREIGSELAARRPRPVDRDNVDELIERLGVQLARTVVTDQQQPINIRFQELDDFEPDQLFENVELFASLNSLRDRLLSESTFSAAASEVLGWGADSATASEGTTVPADTPPQTEALDAADQNVADLLDQMLASAADQTQLSSSAIDLNRLIQEIVAPVMPRRVDPRQDELVACVDSAIATLMSALLHHPHFQELEAAWRGLDFLVRRVETDVSLKIFLVDVSQAELAADLLGDQELSKTGLYRLIVEQTIQTPGAVPWSLLCGLYRFGDSIDDVRLLAKVASIAAAARVPFISAADGSLVGCRDAAQKPDPDQWNEFNSDIESHWQSLRQSANASRVALMWPRFLLRLPYGAATKPIDAFAFEELPHGMRHQHLLWGNPALLAACAIGQSFAEVGWDLQVAQARDLANLPIVTARDNGDTRLQPCGELLLTDRAAEHVRRRGITPVLSIQGRDAIRLPEITSLQGTTIDLG